MLIDLFHNDVKYEFEMLHEIGLALYKKGLQIHIRTFDESTNKADCY